MVSRRLVSLVACGIIAAAFLAGCDSVDPTSQSFAITFHNDTGRNVHLKLCADDACRQFDYSDAWRAGQSALENISDRDLLTRWLVQDDKTGRVLGCLPLRFDQKYEDVAVNVSQAVPCPGRRPLVVHKGKGMGRS
ncbi:MAG TPA: hypothetical protein VFL66_03185 [Gaiellaceae bacterium]|nr:hypothetical protein [Gaiellaceae bacterium]